MKYLKYLANEQVFFFQQHFFFFSVQKIREEETKGTCDNLKLFGIQQKIKIFFVKRRYEYGDHVFDKI